MDNFLSLCIYKGKKGKDLSVYSKCHGMEKVEDQPNFIDFKIFHINLVHCSEQCSPQTHTRARKIWKDIFHFFVGKEILYRVTKKKHQNGLKFPYQSRNYEIKYWIFEKITFIFLYVSLSKLVTILIGQILQHVVVNSSSFEWWTQWRDERWLVRKRQKHLDTKKMIQNGIYWAIDWLKYYILFLPLWINTQFVYIYCVLLNINGCKMITHKSKTDFITLKEWGKKISSFNWDWMATAVLVHLIQFMHFE